jgi:hypothetical protein
MDLLLLSLSGIISVIHQLSERRSIDSCQGSGGLKLEIKRAFSLFDGLAFNGMSVDHSRPDITMP